MLFLFISSVFGEGLNGGFLLDDVIHLKGLTLIQNEGWGAFKDYIFVGGGGPSRRPVAYLSFALQAQDWPNPYYFKLGSLVLHFVNAVLVFVLSLSVFRRHLAWQTSHSIGWALLVALIWAINPIQVSTIHYVIQRMAMFAATFVLFGLIFYAKALSYDRNRFKRYIYFSAYTFCLFLGVLSKENAILLPLLAGNLALFLMRRASISIPSWERACLIWLPTIVFTLYITINWQRYFVHYYRAREFDVWERLLTQCNVIYDYFNLFFSPNHSVYTVFYENYEISRSFSDVAVAVTFIAIMLSSAFILRKLIPLFSVGVLFFFAAHIVESTALSLELYFEHRNYLPSVGLSLALVGLIRFCWVNFGRVRIYFLGLSLLWFGNSVVHAHKQSVLWGDDRAQAVALYENNPFSHRAHGHLAKLMFRYGNLSQLTEFYKNTVELFPTDLSKPMLWIELNCLNPTLPLPDRGLIERVGPVAEYNHATLYTIKGLLKATELGGCSSEGYKMMLQGLTHLIENKNFAHARRKLYVLAGKALALAGNYAQAEGYYLMADRTGFSADVALALAQVYSEMGRDSDVRGVLKHLKAKCETTGHKSCTVNKLAQVEIIAELELTDWFRAL